MRRDFERLKGGPFDLLVVGGGIYGAWIAYDAALRGLKTALVERTDWAAATSSASSKLIHGGLRYLEHFELGLVRRTLGERRRLGRLGPHRVRPLRFGLPVGRGARVGRFRLKAGLALYDLLARFGGGGAGGAGGEGGEAESIGGHRSFSGPAFASRYPFLRGDALTHGFTYGDAQTDDARMTVEVVSGAVAAGAVAVTGASAEALLRSGGRVAGAAVRDVESGRELEVPARVVANCAGPWTGALLPPGALRYRLSKGVHLALPPLPTEDAFLLPSDDDGRIVFLLPWYGRTLLGTTDTDYRGDPADAGVDAADVDYLLERAARWLRSSWKAEDVAAGFAGLRVLPATGDGAPSDVSREWVLERVEPGLFAAVGGKYTSARADAQEAVDRMAEEAGLRAPGSPTAERRFPWAPDDCGDFAGWWEAAARRGVEAGLDEQCARTVALRFGRRVDDVLERARATGDGAGRLVPALPFCAAEIDVAARDEGPRTLADLLARRLPLTLLHAVDRDLAERCAHRAAPMLGWDEARVGREVEAFAGQGQAGAPGRAAPE